MEMFDLHEGELDEEVKGGTEELKTDENVPIAESQPVDQLRQEIEEK